MATAEISDKWTILIDSEREEHVRAYKFVSSTRLEEVKRKWCEDVGETLDCVILTKMDGTLVQSDHTLLEVGESFPGQKNINLKAEAAITIHLEMYQADSFRVRMQARLSGPPEELEEPIRAEFPIPSERHFRLRTDAGPLSPGVGLGAQGVEAGSLVRVELLLEISVSESWSDRTEQYLPFASDPCSLLLADTATPQRLLCDGKVVEADKEVGEALKPFGAPNESSFELRLQVKQEVTVAVNGVLRDHQVWPSQRVESLIPSWARAPVPAGVMFDSGLVPWAARLSSVDLPAGALLHCAPVCVHVRTSDCKVHVVRVPRLGSVADVKAAVRGQEAATHFELRCRGRALEEEESLSGAGVSPGDLLEVEPTGLSLRVTLSDRAVRWRTHRRSFRFSELMEEVSRWGSVVYDELLGRTLCCTGCGRRVRREEEAFQEVPAPCCRVRSLDLEEPTARDFGTQTCTSRRAHGVQKRVETANRRIQAAAFWHQVATQTSGDGLAIAEGAQKGPRAPPVTSTGVQTGPELLGVVQRPPPSLSRGAQAVPFWHQAGTRTQVLGGGEAAATATTGAQTERRRRRFRQQHPAIAMPTPFLIHQLTDRDMTVDLMLTDRPTVWDVRAEVARVMQCALARVELGQTVGQLGAKQVFRVCDRRGGPGHWHRREFGDASGGIFQNEDVDNPQYRTLDENNDRFLLAPRRRNFVTICLRSDCD